MNEPIKTEFFVNEFDVEMRKDTYLDAYGKEVTITIPVGEPVEPIEPEPTQLDRIEETVNNIATNSTSWDAMAQAISEGVNEV